MCIYIYIYIHIYASSCTDTSSICTITGTPNFPTKNLPAKIRRLKTSGGFPMDMRIPPFEIKIMLESSPLKFRILVRRLAVEIREHFCKLSVFSVERNIRHRFRKLSLSFVKQARRIVHYEYMASANMTPVLREAMLFLFSNQREVL